MACMIVCVKKKKSWSFLKGMANQLHCAYTDQLHTLLLVWEWESSLQLIYKLKQT